MPRLSQTGMRNDTVQIKKGVTPFTEHSRRFATTTTVLFLCISLTLMYLDLVPEAPKTSASVTQGSGTGEGSLTAIKKTEAVPESPTVVRVVIDAIHLDVPVLSPESNDPSVLDEALLQGAVHYPGSGTLTDNRGILIFAHSSYLPIVHNQAYKAFNGIQKLHEGDIIKVQSATYEYAYRVTKVKVTDAGATLVPFDTETKQLTLSTCDSFGEKSDRFVVEASYVGKTVLPEFNRQSS